MLFLTKVTEALALNIIRFTTLIVLIFSNVIVVVTLIHFVLTKESRVNEAIN